MQPIDSIETHTHGTRKDLISDKEEIKCRNIKNNTKNDQLYEIVMEKEHNPDCPQILHHPYRILIRGGSGCGKIIALLNLINKEPVIDQTYSQAKDP